FFLCHQAMVTESLAKRRGTTSLTTAAYSPKIFINIIIATPAASRIFQNIPLDY
ncbi:hypothetical protein L9F63_018207, partial [Diploptera punctata]